MASVAAIGGALAVPVAAPAQYGTPNAPAQPAAGAQPAPAVTVKAKGNVFTGGLGFDPASVQVAVGQVVRWTNTDFLVPHTATENHGLWDLGGSYGATPANPPGFGPGQSVQRAFEAGTAHYYCRVHPTQMKGVVAVPVQLALEHARVAVRRRVVRRVHGKR